MVTSFLADCESSYIVILALPKIALSSWKHVQPCLSCPPQKAAVYEEIKTNIAE